MIVVVGAPVLRATTVGGGLAGSAALVAAAAAAAGRDVQLVGKVGDDPDGDALVLALAGARVGHAALLRDPARRTPLLVAEAAEEAVDAGPDASEPGPAIEPADPADRPALEAADVELALRYLTDFGVLVIAEPLPGEVVETAAAAAAYAGAELVVVVQPGAPPLDDATVIEAPANDPEGAFAAFVGALAAELDAGTLAPEGIGGTAARLGWARPEE